MENLSQKIYELVGLFKMDNAAGLDARAGERT